MASKTQSNTKSKSKCLVPGCKRINRAVRGLCKSHYEVAFQIVKSGATTWASLEERGKALPSTRKTSWFRT